MAHILLLDMKVYHVTSAESADAVRAHGFVDATGTYLTVNEYAGVWVSDSPLDINEMAGAYDVCFEIEVPEDSISKFEWVEELKTYREWLVPAEILNLCPRRILEQREIDNL